MSFMIEYIQIINILAMDKFSPGLGHLLEYVLVHVFLLGNLHVII